MFRQPDLEREIQDSVEQLLIGRGMQKGQDYDREVEELKSLQRRSFRISSSHLYPSQSR